MSPAWQLLVVSGELYEYSFPEEVSVSAGRLGQALRGGTPRKVLFIASRSTGATRDTHFRGAALRA
jgi:hypothetical protein